MVNLSSRSCSRSYDGDEDEDGSDLTGRFNFIIQWPDPLAPIRPGPRSYFRFSDHALYWSLSLVRTSSSARAKISSPKPASIDRSWRRNLNLPSRHSHHCDLATTTPILSQSQPRNKTSSEVIPSLALAFSFVLFLCLGPKCPNGLISVWGYWL